MNMPSSFPVRVRRIGTPLVLSLLLVSIAILTFQSIAHARFRAMGAGGCGEFAPAVDVAEEGDIIASMITPFKPTLGKVITKSLHVQGGWMPDFSQTSGCDEPHQVFTDTQDLLDAFFVFTPITPSGLFHEGNEPAITLSNTQAFTFENVLIFNTGVATDGGAIAGTFQGGELLVDDVVISDTVVSEAGGGLWLELYDSARTVIAGSQIISNAADTGGGFAIRIDDGSHLTIADSQILSNTAQDSGGGGYIRITGGGYVTITNNVFAGNQAIAGSGDELAIENTGYQPAYVCLQGNTFGGASDLDAPGLDISGNVVLTCAGAKSQTYLPILKGE